MELVQHVYSVLAISTREKFYTSLRGLLPDGFYAVEGMKCADVDPRCEYEHCFSCSDKSLAMGGAVLEAILHLTGGQR